MSLLEVTNLTVAFPDKTLYRDASFELYKGEHLGVTGQNGAGKSTLIRLLTGEAVPDSGSIRWQSGVRIGKLDQYASLDSLVSVSDYLHTAFAPLYELEARMQEYYEKGAAASDEALLDKAARIQQQLLEEDFYAVDSAVARVAAGLGFSGELLSQPVGELSGGQRTKAILAKLLLEQPDVLLLDEPTNFLDREHVRWLGDYLSAFPGAFIVVSHDAGFLEQIASAILDIEFGTMRKYNGGFSQFKSQKQHLRADYIRRYDAQQKMIKETEAFIRKNIAGVNTKIAQGRRTRLERLERLAPPGFAQKPIVQFQELPLTVHEALSVSELSVGYGSPLLPPLSFAMRSGERLVITGFNGIGKSTLLKTLMGIIPPLSGSFAFADPVRLAYYEQDLKWEYPDKTPLEIIEQTFRTLGNKEARRALARCNVRAEHVERPVSSLSGGEQSKVKLCRLLLSPFNFLILDEPTNHFDAETKQALRDALESFSGCVILVSHEEAFYRGWADRVLDIAAMEANELN